MRLVENSRPVPALRNRQNIEEMIDQSLLCDWVIRVEYSGINPEGQNDWLQWGSTLFAIGSADDVMEAIDACHANYPREEIRLYAEKLQPQMRMLYSVYRAEECGKYDESLFHVAAEAAN